MEGNRVSIALGCMAALMGLVWILGREVPGSRSAEGQSPALGAVALDPRISEAPLQSKGVEAIEVRTALAETSNRVGSGDRDNELVDAAIEELSSQVDASLDGYLYINDLVDQVMAIASLPVNTQVDFSYEDEDSVAYRLLGTPDGVEAHFLVGIAPFDREGKTYRCLQLEIQVDAGAVPEFNRGALRDGPRVHLTLDYDQSGEPGHFALITERRVNLSESQRAGFNAYQGRHTSGAGYKADVGKGLTLVTETFGLIEGQYANGARFQGVSPLVGDIELNSEKVRSLFRVLDRNYQAVRSR